MCGILAYIGKGSATEILIDGLKRLEYRGYDSSGVAILSNDQFHVIKKAGRVEKVAQLAKKAKLNGHLGIGHTRWATHGGVTDQNAHPHLSSDKKFLVVHNGVIENYVSIKHILSDKGYTFESETDSEVIANLIAYNYKKLNEDKDSVSSLKHKNLFVESVRQAVIHLEGTYGLAILCEDYPEYLIGIRKSSPLVIGIGTEENFLASDAIAVALHTKSIVFLNDGEIALISNKGCSITTLTETEVDPVIEQIAWSYEECDLKGFTHYMQKEIFEQPTALENAMRGRFSDDQSTTVFGGLNITAQELRHVDRIVFCACGSAWHACLVAEYLIETYARIPVEVEYASEFRYRNAPLDKHTLVFVVSQSGETMDTLAAVHEAQRKGYRTLAITNVVGSTIARLADGGIYQHAGPEIGVASTKAFTSQLLIGAMMALHLGRLRDMSFEAGRAFVQALKELPAQVASILENHRQIETIAKKYTAAQDFLFLGRQYMFPIALEGALKLKEITYIHAEGYPAAEMKHGPIALISPSCPSVFLATQDSIFPKTLANIQEIKARQGPVIVITSEDKGFPEGLVDDFIIIPKAHEAVQPILASIPLQLFSYYVGVALKKDVDKPRNLAKSVTVE
jgi:glucosamine--fructose-6-phosphate aminotransferase (isomerizing)